MKNKFKMFFLVILSMIIMTGCTFFEFSKPETPVLTSSEQQERIAEIARDYVDTVVTVLTVKSVDNSTYSFGSGVVVHEDGFIATNHHVISKVLNDVANQYKLKVVFNSSDAMHNASIEWSDSSLDLALIKVGGGVLAYAPMKDRFIFSSPIDSLYALETVIAIGTPVSYSYKNTITLGTISSTVGRVSYADNNVYEQLIQHTAFINHGNSGGGLFDLDGNLIGLNTLGHDDAHGLFFAVSTYPIIQVLNKVVDCYNNSTKFKVGTIGILALDRHQANHSGESFDKSGVLVSEVVEGGAASNILQEGDILIGIKVGEKNFEIDIRNHLIYGLLQTKSGSTVELTFKRNNITQTVNITLT